MQKYTFILDNAGKKDKYFEKGIKTVPVPCKNPGPGENYFAILEIICIFAKRNKRDMSKYEIPFLTAAVQAFGQHFAMTRQAAFNYLHKYKGLAFLIEFYDVEHLQSMDETIDDLLIICQQNGGSLT